jgi:hypothetical protein
MPSLSPCREAGIAFLIARQKQPCEDFPMRPRTWTHIALVALLLPGLMMAACQPTPVATPPSTLAITSTFTPAPTDTPTGTLVPLPTEMSTTSPTVAPTREPAKSGIPWQVVKTFYTSDKPGQFGNTSSTVQQEIVRDGKVSVNDAVQFDFQFAGQPGYGSGIFFDNGKPKGAALRSVGVVFDEKTGWMLLAFQGQDRILEQSILDKASGLERFALRLAGDAITVTLPGGDEKAFPLPDPIWTDGLVYVRIQTAPNSAVTVSELALLAPLTSKLIEAMLTPTVVAQSPHPQATVPTVVSGKPTQQASPSAQGASCEKRATELCQRTPGRKGGQRLWVDASGKEIVQTWTVTNGDFEFIRYGDYIWDYHPRLWGTVVDIQGKTLLVDLGQYGVRRVVIQEGVGVKMAPYRNVYAHPTNWIKGIQMSDIERGDYIDAVLAEKFENISQARGFVSNSLPDPLNVVEVTIRQ